MRMLLLLSLLSFLVSEEGFSQKQAKLKTSGASKAPARSLAPGENAPLLPEAFLLCVEQAVLGNKQKECEGHEEDNPCVGIRRSIENSFKRTRCVGELDPSSENCTLWGHRQNNSIQWYSVGSGHLEAYATCVRRRYGTGNSAGYEEALADTAFVEMIRKMDDGSIHLGLGHGALLERVLRGERLSDIIAKSPKGKEMSASYLASVKNAADNATPIRELTIQEEYAGGSNPASEGESYQKLREAYFSESPVVAATYSFGAGTGETIQGRKEASVPLPPIDTAKPNSNGVYVKNLRENPYSLGLDRSLFERVSLNYYRRSRELMSLEQALRQPEAPRIRDLRDLIQK